MTHIVSANNGGTNMLSAENLTGVTGGTLVSATSSKIVVNTNPGPVVTFTGSGIAFSPLGYPTAGAVTGIQIKDQGATSSTIWSGFSVSGMSLWLDIATANLTAIDNLFFNGMDTFTGSAGTDVYSGYTGNDTFNFSQGGNDKASGGTGNDTFNFGGALTAADKIDGGTGTDTLNLNGMYGGAHPVTFNATTIVNVEKIVLAAGHSYTLTTNNATVASGQTLTIDGSALSASNMLTFNGAAETNGHFIIIGGNGADNLRGGALSDTFFYSSALQSTGTHYDTITGFNFSSDKFDIPGGAGVITGINAKVTSGTLSTTSFDANLTTAISASHLGPHHAVLFTPTGGTLSGDTFLVVDLNGVAGYQSGHDLVIRLNGSTGTLAAGAFH